MKLGICAEFHNGASKCSKQKRKFLSFQIKKSVLVAEEAGEEQADFRDKGHQEQGNEHRDK